MFAQSQLPLFSIVLLIVPLLIPAVVLYVRRRQPPDVIIWALLAVTSFLLTVASLLIDGTRGGLPPSVIYGWPKELVQVRDGHIVRFSVLYGAVDVVFLFAVQLGAYGLCLLLRKKRIVFLGALLVGAALVAGGAYVQSKRHAAQPGIVAPVFTPQLHKTYTNETFGLSVTYPASWVSHDGPYSEPQGARHAWPSALSTWVFLGPSNLRPLCNVIQPVSPASYVFINQEDMTMEAARARYNMRIGGQHLKESAMLIDGKEWPFFVSANEELPCADGLVQTFRVLLMQNGSKVFTISTQMYDLQEVRDAFASIHLTTPAAAVPQRK